MSPIEKQFNLLGINEQNGLRNLFSYSFIAMHALDFAATAACRYDAEAARLLRMAQGIVRFRVDKLMDMAFYGPDNNGKKFIMKDWTPVPGVALITSSAAIAAFMSDNNEKAAACLDVALNPYGHPMEIEGDLYQNLMAIYLSEGILSRTNEENLAVYVCEEEKETMAMLIQAAMTVHDLIIAALKLIQDKLLETTRLYACVNCGYTQGVPDQNEVCPLCGAPFGQICAYPVPAGREVKELFGEYFNLA